VGDLRTRVIAVLAVVTGIAGFTGTDGASSTPAAPGGIAVGPAHAVAAAKVDDVHASQVSAGKVSAGKVKARKVRARCTVPKAVIKATVDDVLVVRAHGNKAALSACSRSHGRYVRILGPFPARIGTHGLAKRGAKREGDGRTPTGVFGLGSGFGTKRNPGLPKTGFDWFTAGRSDVWVDDPASTLYNTHQKLPARGRWHSAERLRIRPYAYAQVIEYNEKRIAGRGSAIFLHVGTGGPTAGCVSLSSTDLQAVMRWESTGAVIAIS
jgi:L,D-peptidoglycan transpeptidase YkuD (ErfK/YbiS/YcfS/YnhG family)